jgi:hypothetical protein
MKLFSQHSEMKALKCITRGSKKSKGDGYTSEAGLDAGAYLLASLDESFFHYEPCKVAFARIMVILKKRSQVMSYDDLCEDPSINEEYREVLKQYTKKASLTLEGAKNLVDTLSKYRKARLVYFAAKHALEVLKGNELDVDKLLDSMSNRIAEARTASTDKDPIYILGKDSNSMDLLDEALSPEDDLLYKTGFKEFDDKVGGLPSEGVVILAGTTSGGKSTMRMNLLSRMYKLNKIDVSTVSFEMNAKKESRRLLSFLTKIPLWKFTRKKLTEADREKCAKAWKKFQKFGEKNDCRYALLCPTRGLTLQQTFMIFKPYGFKVIGIDYVSLLEGVAIENQALMLKALAREAKIFSAENHCLVILLAQADSDDGRVRYSKGMLEDADNVWLWNYSRPEDRERKIIPIGQVKGRDQEVFNFELEEAFEVMSISDTEAYLNRVSDSEDNTKSNKRSRSTDDDDASGVDPLEQPDINYSVVE